MKLGILDIGIGNTGSLCGALLNSGWQPELVSKACLVNQCERLILPGVGSFREAMLRMEAGGLVEAIREFAQSGRPLLGICLGMQLLANFGSEGGETRGLSLISGNVQLLQSDPTQRLPHIGWNDIVQQRPHPLLEGIRDGVDFYFLHSYVFANASPNCVIATSDYCVTFASMIAVGNIAGVQFHPEKSQRNGLRLLENFCSWNGEC